ncbi:MAG: hypothetical protein IPN96_07130 [Anaerolineales bacterium]|nr:hypothetical protein [Anaerolineales bacterium]
MQKITDFFKRLFNIEVKQEIEAKNTRDTTVNQTANIYVVPLVGLVFAVALIVGGFFVYNEYQKSKYNYSPMASGRLNVVVVPFSNQTKGQCGAGGDIGSLVAGAFHTALISGEYDETSSVQPAFRSPDEMPALEGSSDAQLTASAEKLAREINAQIVIYGTVTCTELTQKPSAKVMFFVAPAGFSDAQELIGEFSFSSGALYGNLNSGEEFLSSNENLQYKINVMSLVVNSLGSYLGENYSQSLITISAALESPLWESEGGQEVVYILAGNIEWRYARQLNLAGQEERALQEIEQARKFYVLANTMSESGGSGKYARAFIGLAGVEHFYATYKSRASCRLEDIDLAKFELEKENLDHAENALNRPVTADIPEKIAFDKAQIDLAIYAKNPNDLSLSSAEENYKIVILSYTNFENPNLRIQEMAAHSYAGLAFVNWYRDNVIAADTNFNLAIKTTQMPSVQAGYLKSAGNFYAYRGDYEKALIYYREALSIMEEFKIQPANCEPDLREVIAETEKKLP